jgi:hypothetical protein
LNGAHHLVVIYADDVNLLCANVHIVNKNSGTVVDASKKVGLEVNAEETKYMVMTRNHTAAHNHSVKEANK